MCINTARVNGAEAEREQIEIAAARGLIADRRGCAAGGAFAGLDVRIARKQRKLNRAARNLGLERNCRAGDKSTSPRGGVDASRAARGAWRRRTCASQASAASASGDKLMAMSTQQIIERRLQMGRYNSVGGRRGAAHKPRLK